MKKYSTALILAVLFGPLGTIYVGTVYFAVSALIVALFAAAGGPGLLFGWLASIVISIIGVTMKNEADERT